MRKLWAATSIILGIVLAAILGVWGGAVYHESLAAALGVGSPRRNYGPKAGQTGDDGPQVNARNRQTTPTPKPHYHCGMHPWIIQDHPGTCPICHMELTLMQGGSSGEMGTGGPVVIIDPAVVQNMGVQTAVVTNGPLNKTVRVVGSLEVPETGLYDITLRVSGYIDKLYADKTGMHIHKGDPLFDLYSPDLTVAEEELIAAGKSVEAMKSAAPEVLQQAQGLLASARRKLELLDIPDAEIDAIAKLDHAQKDITIRSPAEGHLEEKAIVQGSAVQAGTKLMRIEDHGTMWLEAKVYEDQLSLVQLGQMADATLDAMPGKNFGGKIIFINPHLDHMNRTTSVRVALENSDSSLRPGMYATVQIHTNPVKDAVLAPATAIIDTGTRQVVFIQETKGHFSPRLVTTGLSGDDDQVQIVSGLTPGETVVTSGQFLMDVESRTLEASQKFLDSATTAPSLSEPATSPGTMPGMVSSVLPATTGETDVVVRDYLAIAAYLEQDHADSKPADMSALVQSSGDLAEKAALPVNRPLAKAIRDSASSMASESLEMQHKSFEKVGAAMLALLEKDPPSAKVAGTLYVLNCPMEKADWLQTKPDVSNPFLPSMRTCGSVTKTLTLNPAK